MTNEQGQQAPQWWWYGGGRVPVLVFGVSPTDHQRVLVQDEVADELNELQAALKAAKQERAEGLKAQRDALIDTQNGYEAELAQLRPKAALADEMAGIIRKPPYPSAQTILTRMNAAGGWDQWLARYDALSTPAPATTSKAFQDNLRMQDALGASVYDMPATTTEAEEWQRLSWEVGDYSNNEPLR